MSKTKKSPAKKTKTLSLTKLKGLIKSMNSPTSERTNLNAKIKRTYIDPSITE